MIVYFGVVPTIQSVAIQNLLRNRRLYILGRQREGIDDMQVNEDGIRVSSRTGNTTGRPKAQYPHKWEEEYKEWKKGNQTDKVTMDNLNLKRTTFYKLANLYEAMM